MAWTIGAWQISGVSASKAVSTGSTQASHLTTAFIQAVILKIPTYLDLNVFEDNQPANSISSASMRQAVDTLSGIIGTPQTTNYTAVLADAGTCVEMNSNTGSAVNFIIPANATTAFPIGTVISVYQLGPDKVALVPASGAVVLRTPASLTTQLRYSTITIRKRAIDEWIVSGDLT